MNKLLSLLIDADNRIWLNVNPPTGPGANIEVSSSSPIVNASLRGALYQQDVELLAELEAPIAEPLSFEKELQQVINKHSQENASNTPDYILAEYLVNCLKAYNCATQTREKWYGRT